MSREGGAAAGRAGAVIGGLMAEARGEDDAATIRPRPEIRRLTPTAAECVVSGAPADFAGPIEIWLDGAPLSSDQMSFERVAAGRAASFILRTPGRSPLELARHGAVVRAAGVEAVFPPLQGWLEAKGDECTVGFGPVVVLPNGYGLTIILQDPAGPEIARLTAAVRDGAARFNLPPGVAATDVAAAVLTADGVVLAENLRVRHTEGARLSVNSDFAHWTAEGPAGWTLLAAEIRRGAYAFAPEVRDRRGLSGATLSVRVDHEAFTPILEQRVATPRREGEAEALALGLFGRASRLVEVELALLDGETVVAATRSVCDADWGFRQGVAPLSGAAGPTLTFRVSARALTGQPGYLELAGVACGDDGEGRFEQMMSRGLAPGFNLLVNGDLQHWPNGISGREARTHFETAEGWWFYKHKTDVPAYFAAVPAPDPSVRVPEWGLSISAPATPEGCRLEIKLQPVRLEGRFQVTFTARAGDVGESPGDHHLLDRQWLLVGQVLLFRRTLRRVGQEVREFETPVVVIARQVLLSRQWRTQTFGFVVEPDMLHVDDSEHLSSEYFLGFAVRQSLAMQIRGVRLESAERAPEAPPPPVQLEDSRILAQVGLIRGVEAWLTPVALKAEPETGAIAAARMPTPRWTWPELKGSVEVAVCVHNATEEVLACLDSLARRTTVPHTVRIVDDGSDEDCRVRIEAFIDDKPWMRLTRNLKNLGYTASANRAVLGSSADWVVLLNSDTLVSDGWLKGLLDVAAADPRIALVGPVSNAATYQSVPELYDGAGRWMVNRLPQGWTVQDMADAVRDVSLHAFPDTPLLNGFCTLIRRSVFEEIGGFDEAAFPEGYGEENDMCLRAAKAGYRLCVADHVYVHHVKSASFGQGRRAELTAAGDRALRAMHPEVDFRAIGRQFLETPAMAQLRDALRRRLKATS
ncbi:glycosyltransferase family 2 protein [Phenylobacterium immobile]|uniref:glycosyltransferase family 2 protein n=1 Tax=Phenylobacterium immobile TaxID=21 RepID=UPI000A8D4190|nr:glycosyltransferase family 2 protein [Phenylobacterium immobile]